MRFSYRISKKIETCFSGGMLIFLFLISPLHMIAQQWGGINKAILIGQVTNQLNGGPIKEQEIIIISDSSYNSGFTYHNEIFTDSEGYFYDTILTYYNKGALLISTLDYLNNYHDTTVYFRFNWSDENILFANFILPIEPPQIFYQANFYYQRNPSGQNPSEFQFYDLTNSCNIISHEWNFGDGAFSSEINPVHEFLQSGLYRVMLTVTIQPDPNCIPFVSSIVKIINVTVKNYFYLGGHVMAGYFPIDYGEAYLYKIESKDVVLIDTAIFNDTLGFYLFPQVIEGEYIVKADLCPNSIHYNHFMTTYYSNKPLWTEADTIFHYGANCEYDIDLIPVTQAFTGEGLISGSIIYGFDPINGKSIPAENIEILLLDENLEPVICGHSSDEGEFGFENLDLGDYYVHAEVTGKYTFPFKVSLTESNPEISEILLTIGTYTVNGNVNAVNENNWDEQVGQPYPNPASDAIYINFSSNGISESSISLFSITGQLIKESNPVDSDGIEPLVFHTEDLDPGVYFIRISFQNEAVIRKFVKK
jgi:hypothetical protein